MHTDTLEVNAYLNFVNTYTTTLLLNVLWPINMKGLFARFIIRFDLYAVCAVRVSILSLCRDIR